MQLGRLLLLYVQLDSWFPQHMPHGRLWPQPQQHMQLAKSLPLRFLPFQSQSRPSAAHDKSSFV
jgi:hypothetical protein